MKARLTVVLLLACAIGFGWAHVGAQPAIDVRSVRADLAEVAASYPSVVAEVDGTAISGREFATREYFVKKNAPNISSEDAREVALHHVVQDRVLLDAAGRDGMVVDEREVRQAIADLRAVASRNDELRDAFRLTAEQLGISEEAVFDDQRVIDLYRRAFTLGRMREEISRSLPAEKRADVAAVQAMIDEYVATKDPRVRTFVRLR